MKRMAQPGIGVDCADVDRAGIGGHGVIHSDVGAILDRAGRYDVYPTQGQIDRIVGTFDSRYAPLCIVTALIPRTP